MSFYKDLKAAKKKLKEAKASKNQTSIIDAKIELDTLIKTESSKSLYRKCVVIFYTVGVFGLVVGVKILICLFTGICII